MWDRSVATVTVTVEGVYWGMRGEMVEFLIPRLFSLLYFTVKWLSYLWINSRRNQSLMMELIASYEINLLCFCLILSVIIVKLITIDNSVVSTNFTNWINCQISTWAKFFPRFPSPPPPVPPPTPADHGSDSIQLWPSSLSTVKLLSQPPLSPRQFSEGDKVVLEGGTERPSHPTETWEPGTVHDVQEAKTVEFDRRQWDDWRREEENLELGSPHTVTQWRITYRTNQSDSSGEVFKTNILQSVSLRLLLPNNHWSYTI